jgi:hypothetical protein
METGKFNDQNNLAVITTKKITSGEDWIGYVTHDMDDGSWQFLELSNKEPNIEDAVVVSLENILDLDETINELSDLPLGWFASRLSKTSPWLKGKK